MGGKIKKPRGECGRKRDGNGYNLFDEMRMELVDYLAVRVSETLCLHGYSSTYCGFASLGVSSRRPSVPRQTQGHCP